MSYPIKLQCIKRKSGWRQFYLNIPSALAEALDCQEGENCIVPDSETAAQLNNPKRSESKKGVYHVSRFVYDEAADEFTYPI